MQKRNPYLICVSLFLVVFISFCTQPAEKGGVETMFDLTGKSIVMIVAPDNFRDEELLVPKEILENAGAQITIASKGTKTARGVLGASVTVDKDIKEIDPQDYDAAVFIGGSGASVYFRDETALKIAKEAHEKGKIVAAICIAPTILANAGILDGKKATVWPSEAGNLKSKGAQYTGTPLAQDGNIITANGPAAAGDFAAKIAESLE